MKVCVIPARGGSKRIPRKNIKPFCGQPMIAYSIQAALNSACFDAVIVSTDDAEIAEVALQFGAQVPFMRPAELANDYAGTLPVIKHAVDWLAQNNQAADEVCCLYATAPFVQPEMLQKAWQQKQQTNAHYCFSVTAYASPIQRALSIRNDGRVEMFFPDQFNQRSQDLQPAYHDAGQFYWGDAQAWQQQLPLFSAQASAFVLPRHRVQDIDTPEDWLSAELMFQLLQK
ncbi:MAG: pseudaminic acid cytidylyltransferase [Thiotrichales bacterium]|nr:pseudaminic acid cytidylyltransferase [Thiotrichales bacterium]